MSRNVAPSAGYPTSVDCHASCVARKLLKAVRFEVNHGD